MLATTHDCWRVCVIGDHCIDATLIYYLTDVSIVPYSSKIPPPSIGQKSDNNSKVPIKSHM